MNRLNYMGDYMSAQPKQLVETLKAQRPPSASSSPDSDCEGKRARDSNEGINKLVAAQRSMVHRLGMIVNPRVPGGWWTGWTSMPRRAPWSMAVVR
jgi:hypothetical protein